MHAVTSRAGRRSLPLILLGLVAIAACADDTPPPTAPSASPSVQNAKGLTPSVVMVTNALGNGAFGSLQWATTLVANPGDTIRFDPSLAGDTIFMETTLFVPHYVVIEGARDKGITI